MHSRRFLYLAVCLLSASGAAFAQGVGNAGRNPSSHCMKSEANFCTDCGIDVTTGDIDTEQDQDASAGLS